MSDTDLITKIFQADIDHKRKYGHSCFEEPKDEDDGFQEIFEKELRRERDESRRSC